jgi:predicted neutral ceramidase superfamily lipid hydrolase
LILLLNPIVNALKQNSFVTWRRLSFMIQLLYIWFLMNFMLFESWNFFMVILVIFCALMILFFVALKLKSMVSLLLLVGSLPPLMLEAIALDDQPTSPMIMQSSQLQIVPNSGDKNGSKPNLKANLYLRSTVKTITAILGNSAYSTLTT